jgi:Zn-dependent peptidase ImmA (M78 family)
MVDNVDRKISNIIRRLVKKYKTKDPFQLCSHLGYKVMEEPLGNINGFYQSCIRNKIIHINSDLEYRKKLFICAHELGHALLHSKLNILFLEKGTLCNKNKYEVEADKFASQLMIPDNIFSQYEGYSIHQISKFEGIPQHLLELKATTKA